MTALNPVFTHRHAAGRCAAQPRIPTSAAAQLRERAAGDAAHGRHPGCRARGSSAYPHQLSGGMRQRVMIAMALLCEPDLLIADEPTTALDVTIEAQIVALLKELRAEFDGSIVFVSHSLGLISEICDEVAVMYAGKVVESGADRAACSPVRSHPYTLALLACEIDPDDEPGERLVTIQGGLPDLVDVPAGLHLRRRAARRASRNAPRSRRCVGGRAGPQRRLLAGAHETRPTPSRSRICASPSPAACRPSPASASTLAVGETLGPGRRKRQRQDDARQGAGRPEPAELRARAASRAATSTGADARRPAVAAPARADDLPGPAVVAVAALHASAGCWPSRSPSTASTGASAGRTCST